MGRGDRFSDVPTIKHGDKALRGETDIIEYVNDTFKGYQELYPNPEEDGTPANQNLFGEFFVEMSLK